MTIEMVFKNTPYFVAPKFDGTVTIYKEWPKWQKDMWYAVLGAPPEPAWAPTFEGPFTVTSENGVVAILNRYNFATQATAEEIMHRFNADHISVRPFDGAQGPNSGPAVVRWVVFSDSVALIAGQLAKYYELDPDSFGSTIARDAVLHDIDDARKLGQKLPS